MNKITNIKKVLLYSQDPDYDFSSVIDYLYSKGIQAFPFNPNFEDRSWGIWDAMLTFGGDGTFLRGANIAEQYDIPVVGFNHGHLGFLCSFPKEMEKEGLEKFANGELSYSTRSRLEIEKEDLDSITRGENAVTAFNDLVIKHGPKWRMLDLALTINGEPVTRFTADGLIISTPAGSTGYNLAVGGPIMTPTSKCFIAAPIAPHSITSRPIVFGEDDELTITLMNDAETICKYDGILTSETLKKDESFLVTKTSSESKVVPLHQNVFYTLKEKMNWKRL